MLQRTLKSAEWIQHQQNKCKAGKTISVNTKKPLHLITTPLQPYADLQNQVVIDADKLKEIVSVADAYYLTQKYTHEEVDTSSLESIKNNPIAQVLSKYLQDPSVCTMEGIE